MENRDFARLMTETADLMEIAQEDAFRIRSYRNASGVIEGYPERIEDILKDPARKVTDIPGIGKGMAAVLKEILERGSFERRDEMLEKYPPTALEFLRIPGLGPKTIAMIWEHFRVTTVDELESLVREHKLRELPRMGAKMEEKLLHNIELFRRSAGRYLLSFGWKIAREIEEHLRGAPGVEAMQPAGSVRRGKETIGDLDLLVTAPEPEPVIERVSKYPRIDEILGRGPNKLSARVGQEHIQVDVRVLPRESYGAALQYFTGSKAHSLALRNRALQRGFSLNEYGLYTSDGETRVAGETEDEVYAKLGLPCIAPELRENQGEIEAADAGKLPKLVERSDIRGDLHMHTRASDGRATIEEMALAGKELGYEYIAITDHSKSLTIANGLNEERVLAFIAEAKEINQKGLGIKIFTGLECDIKKLGEMDLDWDVLGQLDLVVGSVHSYMKMERAEMTDRLLKALDCPHLTILGHPTGRLLLQRDAYVYDFERIASEAAKRRVYMEINSSPERLDLHDTLIRIAKSKGCQFTVDTDAHHPDHLHLMRYGVSMARRGWLEKGDVINTLSEVDFTQAIRRG